jgi:hypothetical protein
MPKIEPVPIKTKGKGFFRSTWLWLRSTRKWEVLEDFLYTLKDGTTVVIPKGFIFDGASIPKALRMILSPTGLLLIPGLLHDYAYKYNELIEGGVGSERKAYKPGAGKMFWDKMFREEATRVNGMAPINWAAWSGLFVGGHLAWRKHRKNK